MGRRKVLPDDVKKISLALVQGYERRRRCSCSSLDLRRVQAIEYAAETVGKDLAERERQILIQAIMKSCIEGRKQPFEKLGVDTMERTCFYDRRAKFLESIARYMDLI